MFIMKIKIVYWITLAMTSVMAQDPLLLPLGSSLGGSSSTSANITRYNQFFNDLNDSIAFVFKKYGVVDQI
jgi:hypothetical protein